MQACWSRVAIYKEQVLLAYHLWILEQPRGQVPNAMKMIYLPTEMYVKTNVRRVTPSPDIGMSGNINQTSDFYQGCQVGLFTHSPALKIVRILLPDKLCRHGGGCGWSMNSSRWHDPPLYWSWFRYECSAVVGACFSRHHVCELDDTRQQSLY